MIKNDFGGLMIMDQIPNASQNEQSEKTRNEQKKKKIIKIALIFSAVIVVLSAIFSLIDPEKMVGAMFGDKPSGEQERDIYFYPVEDSEDIFADEEYLQYDRRLFLHEPNTGSTYSIEDSDLVTAEDDIIFFYNYFETVIRGDSRLYREFFSSGYLAENELPDDFTMQMIYDIKVTPLGDRVTDLSYKVEYMILRNNGTFRDDVGSDAIIPLRFELILEDGALRIDSIQKYTTYGRQ
jgi:hypothetical protein